MPVAVKEPKKEVKPIKPLRWYKSLFKELQGVSLEFKELDKIGSKLTQAFRIRHNIIGLREAAMEIIVKQFKKQKKTYPIPVSEEAELFLKRAYEREKSFLRVVGPSIKTTLGILNGIRKQVARMKIEKHEKIMRMIKDLEYVVLYLEKFVKQLEKRSEIEGKVMDYVEFNKNLTKKILKYLEKEHGKELKLERKLFELTGRLKSMKAYSGEYKFTPPFAGAGLGSLVAIGAIAPTMEGGLIVAICAFATTIFMGIIVLASHYEEESKVYRKNLEILAGD